MLLDLGRLADSGRRIDAGTPNTSPRLLHHLNRTRKLGSTFARARAVLLTIGKNMRKVIDLECDLPPDEAGNPRKLELATHPPGYGDPERLDPLPGHGFSNYQRIFTRRTEGGTSAEAGKKHGMSIAAFVALMDRAGVEVGLLRAGNQLITDVLAQYPKRFIGLATISPHDGMRGVREFVRLVQDHGFGGMRVVVTLQHGPGQRPSLLPALREMRGTRRTGAHLLQHELCQRPARTISAIRAISTRSPWIFRNCASSPP